FLEDQAPNWAALIAWNALFAMFPIVIFAASILGYALRLFGQANDAVYKTIFTAIPGDPKQQEELLKAVSGVKSQSGILLFVGLVAGFLLFLSIYFIIPNRKQDFRKVVPGALVAGVLFEAITLLFPLYLEINKGINQYGKTFGLFFLLMTFFFFLGLITMIGVEVNSVIYPVPIELPGKDSHAVATPESGPEGELVGVGGRRGDRYGHAGKGEDRNGRRGGPARAAPGMAGVASVGGVRVGRRTPRSAREATSLYP